MKTIIGIMGPGAGATKQDLINAYEIGKFCAKNGYVTLTGGRNSGVMDEALRGAKENNGLTVGILPNDDRATFSEYVDIPIITNMRSARNYTNALTSDIVVVCGIDNGTASEVSLALKSDKKVILVNLIDEANKFYLKLAQDQIVIVNGYSEANKAINAYMKEAK